MNAKGIATIPIVLVAMLIASMATTAFNETKKNGVLKKNGKIIWCKILGKGNTYCNSLEDVK